jgi:Subtilase family
MRTPARQHAALSLLALTAGLATLWPSGAAAQTVAPLPASDYTARPVCATPSPGHAGCLSLQLVPRTAAARARRHPLGMVRAAPLAGPSPAAGAFGLRPADLHSAYQLPTSPPATQTVAIVDAYNDPTAEADLKAYDAAFLLPACTRANGCFKQVNQNGATTGLPFPRTTADLEAARNGTPAQLEEAKLAESWGLEISLDIEAAHATCQGCRIVLVEASSSSDEDLNSAELAAIGRGATEISNSWGGPEPGAAPFETPFNHPGVVVTASAGDDGYLGWDAKSSSQRGFAEFPASSPHVVAVGGTRLSVGAGGEWAGETVWNGSGAGGGGCSVEFAAPAWQQGVADWPSVGCAGKRAVADVSADADPYSGLAVRYTSPACEYRYEEANAEHVLHWCTIGGTSLSSPVIASVFALAGGAEGVSYPARTLYENELASPASLHDVTEGSNGECGEGFDEETGLSACTASKEAEVSCASKLICLAGTGYDGPTGVGTPAGVGAFKPPAGAQREAFPPREESPAGEEEAPAANEEAGGEEKRPTPPRRHIGSGTGGWSPTPAPPAGGSALIAAPPSGPLRLTGLGLTFRAMLALNHPRPKASLVGFSFLITGPARVRVTLARRARVHGHVRWLNLPDSLTLGARAGRNSARLRGHNALASGAYRLTLAPAHAAARSILFRIG